MAYKITSPWHDTALSNGYLGNFNIVMLFERNDPSSPPSVNPETGEACGILE
jgi:hypothetical protein